MVKSPCVKRCALDETGRYCLGCRRELAEIIGWQSMDDQQKRAVLRRLAAGQTDAESERNFAAGDNKP